MNKYKIEITQVLSRILEVESDSVGQAIIIASQKHNCQEIVLSQDDIVTTSIDIAENDDLLQNKVQNGKFADFVLKNAESVISNLSVEELSKLAFGSFANAISQYEEESNG
jgi:hypothetical protein